MSHKSSISGMGEPVQAIRVINEKRLQFALEFVCKPGRENLDFLQVKKIEMTQKTKKCCIY
jgi:hypothetical protein